MPTTLASGMKALALIGAWHKSLDRMPAVILCVSSVKLLINYILTILTNDVQVLILCHSYFITTVIAAMSSITLKKWQQIITKPTLAIKATKFSFVSNASQFIRPLNHGYFVRTMG